MNETKSKEKNLNDASAAGDTGCLGEPAIQVGASPPDFGSHYNLRTGREDGLASTEGLLWFGPLAGSYRFANKHTPPPARRKLRSYSPFPVQVKAARRLRLRLRTHNLISKGALMPTTTILFGLALIGYGLFLYFAQNPDKSPTALIPAFFGVAFLLLGVLASLKDSLRKHAMHLAAAIGLFGCIAGLGMGLPKLETFSGH